MTGQMFDLSSRAMAMLFYANESCPHADDSITVTFDVPRFDSEGALGATSHSCIGRVTRLDNLNSRVNRIAVEFTEQLPFRPGEQGVSDSDAQQTLDGAVKVEERVRQKARLYEEKKAVVRAEAARKIARIEAETACKIAEARAEAISTIATQSNTTSEHRADMLKSPRGT